MVVRGLEKADHIFVERVHIFDKPLGVVVWHCAGVVDDTEVRVGSKFRFFELRMVAMLGNELLRERLVSGLRKPALLIKQGQHSEGLQSESYNAIKLNESENKDC